MINQEFRIALTGVERTKRRYIDALNAFLTENYRQERTPSSSSTRPEPVPERAGAAPDALQPETETEKLMQIVLVGQPELRDMLDQPSLRQLNERISVRYHLDELSKDDIPDYVGHRLAVAGDTGHLKFGGDAFGKISDYSKGNPRRINILCDRALLIAYAGNRLEIDRKVVKRAIQDLKSTDAKKGTFFARRRKGLFA